MTLTSQTKGRHMTNSPDRNADRRDSMSTQDNDGGAAISENTSFVQMFLDASSRRDLES